MKNVATNSEQSQALLDSGIDPNTASMCHFVFGVRGTCGCTLVARSYTFMVRDHALMKQSCIPAWTLEDLIALLPEEIMATWTLPIGKTEISYISIDPKRFAPVRCWRNFEGDTLLDAAVKAIVELRKDKRM